MIVPIGDRLQYQTRPIDSSYTLTQDHSEWTRVLEEERKALIASITACRTLLNRVSDYNDSLLQHRKTSGDEISSVDNCGVGDVFQVMVTTDGQTLQGRNQGFGGVIRQIGGRFSDLSLQQVLRDMNKTNSGAFIARNRSEMLQPTLDRGAHEVRAPRSQRMGHEA